MSLLRLSGSGGTPGKTVVCLDSQRQRSSPLLGAPSRAPSLVRLVRSWRAMHTVLVVLGRAVLASPPDQQAGGLRRGRGRAARSADVHGSAAATRPLRGRAAQPPGLDLSNQHITYGTVDSGSSMGPQWGHANFEGQCPALCRLEGRCGDIRCCPRGVAQRSALSRVARVPRCPPSHAIVRRAVVTSSWPGCNDRRTGGPSRRVADLQGPQEPARALSLWIQKPVAALPWEGWVGAWFRRFTAYTSARIHVAEDRHAIGTQGVHQSQTQMRRSQAGARLAFGR
jgi:hypothetical protein